MPQQNENRAGCGIAKRAGRPIRRSTAGVPVSNLCLLFALFAAGCGPTDDRLRIQGAVMLDGQPLDRGTIRFTSEDPTATKSAGAKIRDGEFDVPREKGLPPGRYRLQITSPDRSGEMVRVGVGNGNPGILVARERIPESYNIRSEHVVELTASGDNTFEFDIDSGQ